MLHSTFSFPAPSVRGIEDSKSFLFTLDGPSGSEPIRINPTPGAHGGIRCYGVIGPCFGTQRHYDLEVRGNFSATLDLGSGFDYSFDEDSDFSEKMFFELDELEVFKANLV